MQKTVLILSTMDTKGEETLYLKGKVESLGAKTLLMDMAMRGEGPSAGDITPEQVAAAGGSSLEEIHRSKARSEITNITIAGASRIARELYDEGKLHGVMGLGGSTGSLMATEVMRALPFGIPKLMISSTAALPGLSTRYIGTGDIALVHTVVEISGVTEVLKNVLDRCACAMAGMVHGAATSPSATREKAVALTMLGPCEKCASGVRTALEKAGYQVIGFSAAGVGDRAMEEMILQGFFQGVIDLAPGGVGEHLFGFTRDAGPNRLESAGTMGLPQVISTCSVNHITPSKSKYTTDHRERRKYDLDKFRTWLRISTDELKGVAEAFVEKLNRATGPVTVVVPLRGWSSVDTVGGPTYDPVEDLVFVEELRRGIKREISIREVDANMEDSAFAAAVVEEALKIL